MGISSGNPLFDCQEQGRWLERKVTTLEGKLEKVEADFYQALERESRLESALLEAGLEIGEPWHSNAPGEKGSRMTEESE